MQNSQYSSPSGKSKFSDFMTPYTMKNRNGSGHRRIKTSASLNSTMPSLKTTAVRMTQYQNETLEDVLQLDENLLEKKVSENKGVFDLTDRKYRDSFLNYLKAKVIMDEIVDIVEGENLLNLQQELHVEFMFLICSRAKNYLKDASILLNKDRLSKYQLEKSQNPNPIEQEFSDYSLDCQLRYLKIQGKWRVYDLIIEQLRNKFMRKMKRRFHLESSKKDKQKYLDAYEGIDYDISQQVSYTHKNYIQDILNSKEINNQHFKNHRFKKMLKSYHKICEIKTFTAHSEILEQQDEEERQKSIKLMLESMKEAEKNFMGIVNSIIQEE